MDSLQHFGYDPNNASGLNSDRIYCVSQDASGMMWIGTSNQGLNTLNFHQRKFPTYRPTVALSGSNRNNSDVETLYEDPSGNCWSGTLGNGLYKWDRNRNHLTAYEPKPGDAHSLINHYVRNHSGPLRPLVGRHLGRLM